MVFGANTYRAFGSYVERTDAGDERGRHLRMGDRRPARGDVRGVHPAARPGVLYSEPGWIVERECDLRVGGVWAVTFNSFRTSGGVIATAEA